AAHGTAHDACQRPADAGGFPARSAIFLAPPKTLRSTPRAARRFRKRRGRHPIGQWAAPEIAATLLRTPPTGVNGWPAAPALRSAPAPRVPGRATLAFRAA